MYSVALMARSRFALGGGMMARKIIRSVINSLRRQICIYH